ncbi:MAG: hypothetical protein GY696_32335 [Gammaproteobacteria bacterium]|nr:hypothetical protein [Gammaproteobacteria bacterium]
MSDQSVYVDVRKAGGAVSKYASSQPQIQPGRNKPVFATEEYCFDSASGGASRGGGVQSNYMATPGDGASPAAAYSRPRSDGSGASPAAAYSPASSDDGASDQSQYMAPPGVAQRRGASSDRIGASPAAAYSRPSSDGSGASPAAAYSPASSDDGASDQSQYMGPPGVAYRRAGK